MISNVLNADRFIVTSVNCFLNTSQLAWNWEERLQNGLFYALGTYKLNSINQSINQSTPKELYNHHSIYRNMAYESGAIIMDGQWSTPPLLLSQIRPPPKNFLPSVIGQLRLNLVIVCCFYINKNCIFREH